MKTITQADYDICQELARRSGGRFVLNEGITIAPPAPSEAMVKLAAENARLRAALRESIEDNMWNAYHIGIVKDGKWMDGGMSDAEGLRRELGLADGWHDAEAIQDAIPAAAANAVARVVRS
jgi:hypothetical protein